MSNASFAISNKVTEIQRKSVLEYKKKVINRIEKIVQKISIHPIQKIFSKKKHRVFQKLQSPDIIFGKLFVAVQNAKIFSDQKTFADCVPIKSPSDILKKFEEDKNKPDFDLKKFVKKNFIVPVKKKSWVANAKATLKHHINDLWAALVRRAELINEYDSLIDLPCRYVVPGGRFDEMYYWDSYFTMLGLSKSNNWDLVLEMIDNFAHLIDLWGHIPNGNRTYYTSRSQPPFFSSMIDLLVKRFGDIAYLKYKPQLEQEYRYWMKGSNKLSIGQAKDTVVKMKDGSILNRYFDIYTTPRPESYLSDLNTALQSKKKNKLEIYQNLRAGAASGWDFSSRWLNDKKDLSTINVLSLIPVDLNSLLYHLEKTLEKANKKSNNLHIAKMYSDLANKRLKAINRYLWNEKAGYYSDYNWKKNKLNTFLSAATVFPLYVKAANNNQAIKVGKIVEKKLLKKGGLVTTTVYSGQQWDYPNVWAPLQWVAVKGFEQYNNVRLSKLIGLNFLKNVETIYQKKHKLFEKYIAEGEGMAKGGEYLLQDGFGWTNGVTLMLLDKYAPVIKNKKTPLKNF
ncbi:periplasmic trehalase TreA [Candidatus Tachikawaea gelatinosa]|uniref:Periplasmic trehalase TreA n=2 Tax=Candidatus Tachikawaea gelatinosa TaxID=1410383 RepID=A0A090AR68_9ENTR|nr:periplasmic trehalase TreA [Candidatus Tachikawaea gelatinosa]